METDPAVIDRANLLVPLACEEVEDENDVRGRGRLGKSRNEN